MFLIFSQLPAFEYLLGILECHLEERQQEVSSLDQVVKDLLLPGSHEHRVSLVLGQRLRTIAFIVLGEDVEILFKAGWILLQQ